MVYRTVKLLFVFPAWKFKKMILALLIGALTISSGCSDNVQVKPPEAKDPSTNVVLIQANLTFSVDTPVSTPQGLIIYIDILDEVSGLAFNPIRYALVTNSQNNHEITIPFPIGSVVKYRYLLEGKPPTIELNGAGNSVRYRMYHVNNPAVVKDRIAGWADQSISEKNGILQGLVINSDTGNPVIGVMINVAGQVTFTSGTGRFFLQGLPGGTHNMVAYSLDGAYRPFQQEATIVPEATTSATFAIQESAYVDVTFIVQPPPNSIRGAPIRIMGNIHQFGNTFSDLNGGISAIASRAPYLLSNSNGSYSLRLKLPTGLDLRYKYSLGDGFWNAENNNKGEFTLRQFIVPKNDVTIHDTIALWANSGSDPLTFFANVPASTPPTDTVSIQFNPHIWMEPIPMWPLGNNQWMYILYSPMNLVNRLSYRYCRNDHGFKTAEVASDDAKLVERTVSVGSFPQTMSDEVTRWKWWEPSSLPTTIVTNDVQHLSRGFLVGVEMEASYHPADQSYVNHAYSTIRQISGNLVIITPTWTFQPTNIPLIEPVPGKDPLYQDILQQVSWIKKNEMEAVIFPQTHMDPGAKYLEKQQANNSAWLIYWQQQYRNFLVYNAILAAQTNASSLILGETDSAFLALKQYYSDLQTDMYKVSDYEKFWRQTITEIRKHFGGKIIWAMEFPEGIKTPPEFLDEIDMLYILWSSQLSDEINPVYPVILKQIEIQMDTTLLSFWKLVNKPIIIGVGYPSANGSANGCIKIGEKCQSFSLLGAGKPDIPGVTYNPKIQSDIYNAFMVSINTRPFIKGIVSRGFSQSAALQDNSLSIHGKAASDILWYWYPRLIGKIR